MNRFTKRVLDAFARREGYEKKPFKNWAEYKKEAIAGYRTGLGTAREHPIVLKDLEEVAMIAEHEMGVSLFNISTPTKKGRDKRK